MQSLNDLKQYGIRSADGEIGTIRDFYFDDQTWNLRYAVVSLDPSLGQREILLSTAVFGSIHPMEGVISTKLDLEKIRNSPELDFSQPITRKEEADLSSYYLWPEYWIPNTGYGMGLGDLSAVPMVDLEADLQEQQDRIDHEKAPGSQLYSMEGISGFHILTTQNEDIGVVSDFLMDDDKWAIEFLVANVSNWAESRRTILSPKWIERFSLAQSLLFVELERRDIETSPQFDGQLDDAFVHDLFQHYEQDEVQQLPDESEK